MEAILIEPAYTTANCTSPLLEKEPINHHLESYIQDVFGIAYHYLHHKENAMDMVMNTYEIALKKLDSTHITNAKSWLFSICRNQSLKFIRDRKIHHELAENLNIPVESIEERVLLDVKIEKILSLIPELKQDQRKCVEAFYLRNMTYEEVADRFGYGIKQVKSHIQNGKRNLRIMYDRLIEREGYGAGMANYE